MIMHTECTLTVCEDCAQMLANGEVTDSHGTDVSAAHDARMRALWGDKVTDMSLACDGDDDESCDTFSSTPCGGCGSTLGGSRHAAVVLAPSKPTPRDELFSQYATQSLYASVYAYSHRQGVNVMVGASTAEYGRPSRGVSATDHVRECVDDAVRDYSRECRHGAYDPDKGWAITGGPTYERGEYRYSVWMPKPRP